MTRPKFQSKRGPVCSICAHPDRSRIEATRVAGASLDNIAAKFNISRFALHRHMHAHVTEDVRAQYLADIPIKELAAKAASEGVSVLEYLSLVRSVLMTQFQLSAAVNDRNGVAILAGRLTEVLRSIGSISGELGDMARSITVNGNIVNVMNHPQLATLQMNLLKVLAKHPAARADVVAMLRGMDAPTVDAGLPLLELRADEVVNAV